MNNKESLNFQKIKIEKIEKKLTPNGYAILIEEGVIENYISEAQKTNPQLSKTELEIKWIQDHGAQYRFFFNQHQEELIERYKKDPQETLEYIKTELEKSS